VNIPNGLFLYAGIYGLGNSLDELSTNILDYIKKYVGYKDRIKRDIPKVNAEVQTE
jgi:hypothetical protein